MRTTPRRLVQASYAVARRARQWRNVLMLWAIVAPRLGLVLTVGTFWAIDGITARLQLSLHCPEFITCWIVAMLWPLVVIEVYQRRNRFLRYAVSWGWGPIFLLGACNGYDRRVCVEDVQIVDLWHDTVCAPGAHAEVFPCPGPAKQICVVCRCPPTSPSNKDPEPSSP